MEKYRIATTREQKCWVLLLYFAITTIVVARDQQKEKKESDGTANTTSTTNTVNEPAKPQEQKTFDRSILVGDWIRTDAEYRIAISELSTDVKCWLF